MAKKKIKRAKRGRVRRGKVTEPPPPIDLRPPLPRGAEAFLIFAVTLVVFWPALGAGFIWDDNRYIVDNESIRTFSGLLGVWFNPGATVQYHPLLFTGHALEYFLWDVAPLGYHLVSVLLHAVNSILVGSLLSRLKVPGAWFAAALFALHPVHVEPVAWIAQRKELLGAFFSLLTLLGWLRFERERTLARYGVVALCFALALGSNAAVWPLPLVMAVGLWWRAERFKVRDAALVVPLLAMSIAMGLVHFGVERGNIAEHPTRTDLSFAEDFLIGGRALLFYGSKIAWPAPLMTIYPKWDVDPRAIHQWLFPISAALVPVALYLPRRRIGKGALMAVALFGLMLLPSLGFIPGEFFRLAQVADRFQYLASLGPIAVVGALAARGASRIAHEIPPPVSWAGAIVLLALLGNITRDQSRVYENSETLWVHNIAHNNRSPFPYHARANSIARRGDLRKATTQYEKALEIDPDFPESRHDLAEILRKRGLIAEALVQYDEALRLAPNNASTHNGLGLMLGAQNELVESIHHFTEAVRIDPDRSDSHYYLGLALGNQGRLDEAIEEFETALGLDPENENVQRDLDLARNVRDDNAQGNARDEPDAGR